MRTFNHLFSNSLLLDGEAVGGWEVSVARVRDQALALRRSLEGGRLGGNNNRARHSCGIQEGKQLSHHHIQNKWD